MPEVIEKHYFARAGRRMKYPPEWLDGRIWKLKQGVDYKTVIRVRSALRQVAIRIGGSIRTDSYSEQGFVFVQFLKATAEGGQAMRDHETIGAMSAEEGAEAGQRRCPACLGWIEQQDRCPREPDDERGEPDDPASEPERAVRP